VSSPYIVLCFCFVFLRFVHHMLPVFLDCPFLIASSFCNCSLDMKPPIVQSLNLSLKLFIIPFSCYTYH
jgi:hypothetical protein